MPLNSNEKSTVFEYAILKIALSSIQINGVLPKSTQIFKSELDFNLNNNFSFEKLMSFPYFLCLSNGHREFMFNELFNKFILPDSSNSYCFVEEDLYEQFSGKRADFNYYFLTPSKKTELVSKINGLKPFEEDLINAYFNNKQISSILLNRMKENNYSVKSVIDYSVEQLLAKKKELINAELNEIRLLSTLHPGFNDAILIDNVSKSMPKSKDSNFSDLIKSLIQKAAIKSKSPLGEKEFSFV